MKSFMQEVEALEKVYKHPAVSSMIDWFLVDRDARFQEGNDKTWGKGNWIRCHTCLDSLGYPAYHHKDAHAD